MKFPDKWNVIPIKKNTKKPAIVWGEYQEKKFPRHELFNYEICNYGVICGETSNNLVILDFDFEKEVRFDNILANLKRLFPVEYQTYMVITPHGLHIYYYINGECPKRSPQKPCVLEEVKFLDILGEGGYALIPPSMIGVDSYNPIFHNKVRTITRKKYDEIIGHYVIKKQEKRQLDSIKRKAKQPLNIKKFRLPLQWLLLGEVDIKKEAKKTGTQELLYWTSLYAEAIANGYEPKDLYILLARNQPEFKIDIANYQLENHINKGDLDHPFTNRVLKKMFSGYTGVEKDVWVDISEELEKEFDVAVMSDSDKIMMKEGNIYTYKTDAFYKELDRKVIERTLGKRYSYYIKQIIAHIKLSQKFDRDNFCYEEDIIPFLNGYYDTGDGNGRFIPAKETDKIFCYAIPHNYIEGGGHKCPKFLELLGQWLYNNGNVTEDDIFEMIGYTMTMDVSQRKAFFILGPTTTGKTSFQNILETIIGKENRIGTAIQEFGSSRFSMDNMENKVLNMVGDMSGSQIEDTSYFKLLTGGDTNIQAEVKGGNKYSFRNITKIWYNANRLPMLKYKNDDAFHLRWIIIQFLNRFPTQVEGAITKIDRQITNDEDEIQGIIHKALAGLRRLNKRGYFRPEIQSGTTHIWNYKSDVIYAFLYDNCIKGEHLKIEASDLHSVFNTWMWKNHKRRLTPYKIKTLLEDHGIYKDRLTDDYGERIYAYYGIELKPDEPQSIQSSFNY